MALDVNVCLKALSASFCQYRSHTTEQSVKDLERHIDVSFTSIYIMCNIIRSFTGSNHILIHANYIII